MTKVSPSTDAGVRHPAAGEPAALRTCPNCRCDVPQKAVLCPQCGWWDRPPLSPDRYQRVIDPIAGVLMFGVSVLAAVPTTAWLVHSVRSGRHDAAGFLFVTLWHLWLWGFPALCLIVAWRKNIFSGRAATDGLWKLYRHMQLIALLLPLVLVIVFSRLLPHFG